MKTRVSLKYFVNDCRLKNIICTKKDELIRNSCPGVIDLNVPAGEYRMVKQKKKTIAKSIEHHE